MLTVIDVEQGSPEWFDVRKGMPTASEFETVLANGRKGEPSKTRLTYMRKLAGEIITGKPAESYMNQHMERGKEMEPEARTNYCFLKDAEVTRVGFIVNGQKGCSPDSLIGNAGALEIKTQLPHILIGTMHSAEPPFRAQCQGVLWVAEREWIDLVVYWPDMPLYIKRQYRDESFIKDLSSEVDRFNEELAKEVEFVRSFGKIKVDIAA